MSSDLTVVPRGQESPAMAAARLDDINTEGWPWMLGIVSGSWQGVPIVRDSEATSMSVGIPPGQPRKWIVRCH